MSLLDSNREGHLAAAFLTGLGIIGYSAYSSNPAYLVTGVTTILWEAYATPDMDHASRQIWGSVWRRLWVLWWKPYSKLVGHRSRWSHSLLFGLPIRLFYGLIPLWLWLGYVVHGCWQTGEWGRLVELWRAWSELGGHVLVGCLVADVIHLAKDKYGPIRMVFGSY